MKNYFFLLILFFLVTCKEKSDNPQIIYIDKVIDIIEKNSINTDSIDFISLRTNAHQKLNNSQSIKDCYPVIDSILITLKDNHSFFLTYEENKKRHEKSRKEKVNEIINFSGRSINKEIGYLIVNGYGNTDSIATQTFTDSLHNLIKSIDNKNIKGWIVDIRQNTGGNCWPMLTGLGPLIGKGICGYFLDNKNIEFSWFYKNGTSGIDTTLCNSLTNIKPYKLIDSKSPIAVLIGKNTASSGEVVATSFLHKTNVRFFGNPTAGLTSGNEIYLLEDSSLLILTTSIYMDRERNLLGGKIHPDKLIKPIPTYNDLIPNNDTTIDRAVEWILSK